MNLRLPVFALMMFLAYGATSQGLYLSAYTNYVFDDKFDSYYDLGEYYSGKVKGGFQWGAGLEYKIDEYHGVELVYLRQDTEAPTTYLFGGSIAVTSTFDLDINYVMIGGVRHQASADGKIEGFGGILLGGVFAKASNPLTNNSDNASKFAWGLRAGGIFWPADRIGIRLQAELLSAVQAVGGSLYFGTGGAGAGVATYSTLYQFGLGGGIVIKLADTY